MAETLGVLDGRSYLWDKNQIYRVIPDVREAVRAGDGRELVIADYSQIEVRLMAFMAQEPSFITALNDKRDIHCHMTSLVFNIPYDLLEAVVVKKDKKHPQYNDFSQKRSSVKVVTFGVPYGAGPGRVGQMIQEKDSSGCVIEDIDHAVDRARELIDNYFAAAPRLKEWLQEQKRLAQTLGYTSSIEGRKRFYNLPPKDHPDYEKIMSQIGRYAGNHPIQSSSADMLKDALRRLYLLNRGWDGSAALPWTGKKVLDANLLLVAHDEIVTDAAQRDVERQAAMVVQAMGDAYRAVTMTKVINGAKKVFYLRDIYADIEALCRSFWAKD